MKIKTSDVIEWDIVNWSIALKFWSKNTKIDLRKASALELGARNGGLSLWMASKGAKVICSDLEGPTDLARERHKKMKLDNLIEYKAIDATDIYYTEYFNIVVFKSMLGGVGRDNHKNLQEIAIQQIYKSLKFGGELWFAENLKASLLHQFFRRKFVRWGSSWRYITLDEFGEMFSQFSERKFITAGFFGAFGRNELQKIILGSIDRVILNTLLPAKCKYIIVGIAKKL